MRILSFFLVFLFASCPLTPSHAEEQQLSLSAKLNEEGVKAMQAKNFPLAVQIFKKSMSTDPYNLTAVFNLGAAYLSQEKYRDAIELLEPYAARNVDDAGIYVRLGDAYFASKDIHKAKTSYERAVALAPKYFGLQAKLGTIYALNKNLPLAEKAFRQAIEINQKDGQSLANLSSVLLALKKPEEAIQTAKRALQVQPSADVYITLGNAYEILRDRKNALISFQRAHDLGNTSKELNEKIEQLKAHS